MLQVAEKILLDNNAEVTTYFINDENMKNCPHIDIRIGNGNVKGVVDTGSEISLITEDICTVTVARNRDVGAIIAKHGACNRVWQ